MVRVPPVAARSSRSRLAWVIVGGLVGGCGAIDHVLDVEVWDAGAGCFRVAKDALDRRDLPAADCPAEPTPAVRADGVCVVLPVACTPRGYAPAAAAADCDAAFAAFAAGDAACDDTDAGP